MRLRAVRAHPICGTNPGYPHHSPIARPKPGRVALRAPAPSSGTTQRRAERVTRNRATHRVHARRPRPNHLLPVPQAAPLRNQPSAISPPSCSRTRPGVRIVAGDHRRAPKHPLPRRSRTASLPVRRRARLRAWRRSGPRSGRRRQRSRGNLAPVSPLLAGWRRPPRRVSEIRRPLADARARPYAASERPERSDARDRPERAAFRRRRRGCSFGRSSHHLTVLVPAAGRCSRTRWIVRSPCRAVAAPRSHRLCAERRGPVLRRSPTRARRWLWP